MRKGMFDMMAPLAFFIILIAFAMFILLTKIDDLKVERPELDEDLANQKVHMMLVATLGQPTLSSTLGDLMVQRSINDDAKLDRQIVEAFDRSFQGRGYKVDVIYPNGDIVQIYNFQPLNFQGVIHTESWGRLGSSQVIIPGAGGPTKINLTVLFFDNMPNYVVLAPIFVLPGQPQPCPKDRDKFVVDACSETENAALCKSTLLQELKTRGCT